MKRDCQNKTGNTLKKGEMKTKRHKLDTGTAEKQTREHD